MPTWLFTPAFVLAAVTTSGVVSAQCPAWSSTFHSPGIEGSVFALTVFDDGGGPALFAGGSFQLAGTIKAQSVVKWDGATWSAVGTGMGSGVADLRAFDDGSGPALFATGSFVNADGNNVFGIAKWDGASWSALGGGLNSPGQTLAVFDDGSGPALYVGGFFTTAGGVSSQGVARWDGSTWSSVGGGLALEVAALAVHDDGSGPALFAGGRLSGSASALMKWNGATWTPVAAFAPIGKGINALAVHDDGAGAALYAGGDFNVVAGVTVNRVAKWDGATWSALGAGLSGGVAGGAVTSLISHDDGSGAALFVGGGFTSADSVAVSGLARWNGSAWSDVAGGTDSSVNAMVEFDDGDGSHLWLGGAFFRAGNVGVRSLASWDGAAWSAADPTGQGLGYNLGAGFVKAFASIDDGSGTALYTGGYFRRAGTTLADGIARWNGTSWSSVGSGVGTPVWSIAGFDDGAGTKVYAGTNNAALNGFAQWDGVSWTPVGGGVSTGSGGAATVTAMALFDDGSGEALFAGGTFVLAGGLPASAIAKWDGANWSALGSGMNNAVNALIVHDDGTGPALYATGDFTLAGGAPANYIAKWDGALWSTLGSGLSNRGHALAVHDDGGGPALYVGGVFTSAGGVSAGGIARWDGASWHALGSGVNHSSGEGVLALASYDDGVGPALFAGGFFDSISGTNARNVARWDGANWSPLGTGLIDAPICRAMGLFQDGTAPQGALFVGGEFTQVNGAPSTLIASWTDTCACAGESYCTSGTTSNGCVPTISGTGRASASATSGFTLSVSGVDGQKQGHIFYGLNGPNAASWGASSHFLCVKAPSQRTGTQDSGGTAGACDGVIALDWNTYCATHPSSLGIPFSAGTSVWAQLYFRDPAGPKTTALSNGLAFTVCP